MSNRQWMLKNIESEPHAVSGKVVKPDLVLVEGHLQQVISFVDEQGIVNRRETKAPFSRQVNILGALPGHTVSVELLARHTKPVQGARGFDTTLVSLDITVTDNQAFVGFATEEFLLQEPREQPPLAKEPVVVETEAKTDLAELEKLRQHLETEYALRYQQECFEFEKRLRDSYQDDLRTHVEQLRREMEEELSRRWKQQLSSYQRRNGYRGSVEFGRA